MEIWICGGQFIWTNEHLFFGQFIAADDYFVLGGQFITTNEYLFLRGQFISARKFDFGRTIHRD